MGKIIKYIYNSPINRGTEDAPDMVDYFMEVSMPYSESNMAIAEAEAYGEITIENDGQPEPTAPETTDDRVTALEAKLSAMEAAYIEGVQEA